MESDVKQLNEIRAFGAKADNLFDKFVLLKRVWLGGRGLCYYFYFFLFFRKQ